MSRKYERNDKIALLYPANLLAAQTYFQLSFVFVQLRVVFGGRNSVTFRWDTCFRPICRTVLPNLVRIIRLISKQIFHPEIDSRLIISYPSLASFTCPPVRQKSSGIFFYICDHVCILVVRPPTLLPTCLCSPSQRMLAAVLCALMVVESIMAILLLPAFAASDVKTSRKAPLLLQRAKRLRIVSNFPYFSGISLHDRPCFVTQLAQLMTTRARKFFSVAGDWQKFFKTC